MRSKQNLYIVTGVLTTIAGILLLIIRTDIAYAFNLKNPITIAVVAGSLLLYGIGFLLFSYLQYNRRIEFQINDTLHERISIQNELEKLKLELLTLQSSGNNAINTDDINKTIKNIIKQNLETESFLDLLENNFGQRLTEEFKINRLNRDFENIGQRISAEIARLSRSANINLVFGSVTTLIAIAFLGYEVLYKKINFTELIPLLSHYIPRIAIVIFVEIFAFFFLKIYKTNLNDIKYFHNEKSNIDLKLIAIKTALISKNDGVIQSTIEEFAKTERNFILKKDETTIELEKVKVEARHDRSMIDALKEIIRGK